MQNQQKQMKTDYFLILSPILMERKYTYNQFFLIQTQSKNTLK